jgi:hypothetical protein
MKTLLTILALHSASPAQATPVMNTAFSCYSPEASIDGDYETSGELVLRQPYLNLKIGRRQISVEPGNTEYRLLSLGKKSLGRTIAFTAAGLSGVLTVLDFGDDDYASTKKNATLLLHEGREKKALALSCSFSST